MPIGNPTIRKPEGARPEQGRSVLRTIAAWLTGCLIIAVMFWQTDKAALAEAISNLSPAVLALAIVTTLPMIAIKAFRWHLLLSGIGLNYPASRSLLSFLISLAFSVVTPGRVGEIYRAWPAARYCGTTVSRASSSVVLDRFLDLFTLIGLSLLGLPTLASEIVSSSAMLVFSLLCLCFLSWFLIRRFPVTSLRKWPKAMRAADDFQNAFAMVPRRTLILAICLTLLSYGIYFAIVIALATVIGIAADALTVCIAVAIGGLASMLPISVSGLGTRDASIVFLLGMNGIASSEALGLSMAIFFVFYLSAIIFGLAARAIERNLVSVKN